ncbi:MAG: preprotein translocase subunit YajC [Peptostreptococcaceae bacterium]|nr:preprotein translocase subunit YajC [Peptostreptococcaceae bacterium]
MDTALQLLPLILLIFIMYFLLIRPQKKREKATNQMRNNLQVGDEIITIGGVRGKIVKVKDETLIIQVGAEKIKFEIMRWAVSKVENSDSNSSTKKDRTAASEKTPEEAPKKVIPKKMFKKSAPPVEETVEAKPEGTAAEALEKTVIEIPEEDVTIIEKNNEEKL